MNKDTIISIHDSVYKFAGSVKLSDNIEKTKEGYLKCYNVIMGRSGYQKYLGIELSGLGFKDDEVVEVLREEHEVFREETLKSGEGKPVTLDHPTVDVTVDNIKSLGKGTILTKLWREEDNQVGDIVITDKELVKKVEDKELRELSLGYSTRLIREGNQVKQTNILINHLAVLKYGRAGNAAIRDGENIIEKKEGKKNMDLKDAIKLVTDSGFTLTIDAKKDDKETKSEKEYQEGDEKKAKDTDKEEKQDDKKQDDKDKKDKKVDDEDKDDDKDEDKKDKKEKDAKGKDKDMVKEQVLKLLLDGKIDNDTAKAMLGQEVKVDKEIKDNIFGGVTPTNITGASDVKVNDYSVVTGNEMNEHLQKLHDANFSHRELTKKYNDNYDIRSSIMNAGEVRDSDFIKLGGK